MTDTTTLTLQVRLLAQVLSLSGNVEPAERFARLHDELVAQPRGTRLREIVDELLASSRVAQQHAFDLEAREAFAKVWTAAKAVQRGGDAAG